MQNLKRNRYESIKKKVLEILKDNKVQNPPIVLKQIVNYIEKKYKVVFQFKKQPFSKHYSGQIIIEGKIVGILYNQNDTMGRQRFTIAHELGHFALGHLERSTLKLEAIKINTTDPIEKEANVFAANLLMPDFLMKKEKVNSKDDIVKLAEKYQVSYEAMNYKVCTSNYLTGITLDKTDYFQKKYQEKEEDQNIEEDMRPIEEESYDDLARRIYSKE